MYRIYAGIPTIRRYEPFWQSMDVFIPALKQEYEVEICIVKDMKLAEARNTIVDMFMKSGFDYLLFMDDDHSGHTMAMFNAILDPMINNDAYMCGIKCHAKSFPYASNILMYSHVDEKALGLQEGQGRYMPVDIMSGYVYCDLVGFGMTLISRKAFEFVIPPYFVSDPRCGQGREDNFFCEKLIAIGHPPVGCGEYTLDHQGIGKHNAYKMRDEGMAKIKEKYPDMKVLVS